MHLVLFWNKSSLECANQARQSPIANMFQNHTLIRLLRSQGRHLLIKPTVNTKGGKTAFSFYCMQHNSENFYLKILKVPPPFQKVNSQTASNCCLRMNYFTENCVLLLLISCCLKIVDGNFIGRELNRVRVHIMLFLKALAMLNVNLIECPLKMGNCWETVSDPSRW